MKFLCRSESDEALPHASVWRLCLLSKICHREGVSEKSTLLIYSEMLLWFHTVSYQAAEQRSQLHREKKKDVYGGSSCSCSSCFPHNALHFQYLVVEIIYRLLTGAFVVFHSKNYSKDWLLRLSWSFQESVFALKQVSYKRGRWLLSQKSDGWWLSHMWKQGVFPRIPGAMERDPIGPFLSGFRVRTQNAGGQEAAVSNRRSFIFRKQKNKT